MIKIEDEEIGVRETSSNSSDALYDLGDDSSVEADTCEGTAFSKQNLAHIDSVPA